jgi:type IV secretory pathway VirB9-like protein
VKFTKRLIGTCLAFSSLVHAGAVARAANRRVAVPKPSSVAEARPVSIREVAYNDKDVVHINSLIRFSTLLVLPKGERIIDFICGDKDYWVINGNENIAEIKPAKMYARTNLNLITASGNIYSFLLEEVSEEKVSPDLKVFIKLQNAEMSNARNAPPVFVTSSEVEQLKADLARAQAESAKNVDRLSQATARQARTCTANVRFGYRFDAGKKPFFVRAICHDDRFTYIQARPEETPTVYEVKDGKPNLVNFTYQDGIYQINKIVEHGYLAVGKQKMSFLVE